MKNFNILGVHRKTRLLRGGRVTKNPYRGGRLPKKEGLGLLGDLRGAWQERVRMFLRGIGERGGGGGVETPMQTGFFFRN